MANDYNVSIRLQAVVDGLRDITRLIAEIQDLGGSAGEAGARSERLARELQSLRQSDQLIQDFRALRTTLGSTSAELANAQARAQALGREISQTERPTQRLREEFARARAAVRDLAQAEQDQRRALQDQRAALANAGIDTRNLAGAQIELRQNLQRTEQQIAALNRELTQLRDQAREDLPDSTRRLRRGLNETETAAEGLLDRLRNFAAGIAIAAGLTAAFQAVKSSLVGILGIGGEFERLQASLDNLTGSAEKGAEAFAWIKEFARETPFQLQDVARSFNRLKAFGLDPMDGTLRALANATARLGGSQENLLAIINAVGQAWSKRKLQGEELMQLTEQGIPVWDRLAEATGKSVVELRKLSEAGKLGRNEIRLLVEQIGKTSQGALEAQMKTLNGLVSNVQDTWSQFVARIANSGLMEYAKKQLSDLLALFERAKASGDLKIWAQNISDAFVGLGQTIQATIAFVREWSDEIIIAAQATAAWKLTQWAGSVQEAASSLREGLLTALTAAREAAAGAGGRFRALGNAIRAIPTDIKVAIAVAGFYLLTAAGKALGEFLASHSDAAAQLEKSQTRIRAQLQATVDEGIRLQAQAIQYKDTLILTAEEVARLTATERAQYRARLEGLNEYLKGQLKSSLALQQLDWDQKAILAQLSGQFAAVRQGFKDIETGAQTASAALASTITPAAQGLIDQFKQLKEQGHSTTSAITELFAAFKPSSYTSVQSLIQALGVLREESFATAKTIKETLRAQLQQLSAQDLLKFQINARAAFESVAGGAGALARTMQATLGAALRQLGVDTELFASGMTTAGKAAVTALQVVIDSGRATAAQLKAAFQAAAESIQTQGGIDALRSLAQDSLKTTGEVASAIRAIIDGIVITSQTAADKTKENLKSVQDSAKNIVNVTNNTVNKTVNNITQVIGLGEILARLYNSAKEQARAASAATEQLFTSLMNGRGAVVTITSKFSQLKSEIAQLKEKVGETLGPRIGLTGYLKSLNHNLSLSLLKFKEQTLEALKLTRALESVGQAGGQSLQSLIRWGNGAIDRMGLLGQEKLSSLRAAIANATARLQSLRDAAQSTLSTLREELAGLQGDYTRLAELRAEQRLNQIRA